MRLYTLRSYKLRFCRFFKHGDESPCYSNRAPSMGLRGGFHPALFCSTGIYAREEKRSLFLRSV